MQRDKESQSPIGHVYSTKIILDTEPLEETEIIINYPDKQIVLPPGTLSSAQMAFNLVDTDNGKVLKMVLALNNEERSQ